MAEYEVFVTKLADTVKEGHLTHLFQKECGGCKGVNVVNKVENGGTRTFAFVKLDNIQSYNKALALHGTNFHGKQIQVYPKESKMSAPSEKHHVIRSTPDRRQESASQAVSSSNRSNHHAVKRPREPEAQYGDQEKLHRRDPLNTQDVSAARNKHRRVERGGGEPIKPSQAEARHR
uniref:RRM domain-containing protein n=1 Tax=Eutreptiella gymnastica TaxID=73025 RepID=A0A7S1N884_9EUGL|mmetsp:Transcript_135205/g.234458  ORF Transcript_135205/g.234458 Transcript_135205/m.234458 type:complete len:176 (+) Transcript_135205:182-709(+)